MKSLATMSVEAANTGVDWLTVITIGVGTVGAVGAIAPTLFKVWGLSPLTFWPTKKTFILLVWPRSANLAVSENESRKILAPPARKQFCLYRFCTSALGLNIFSHRVVARHKYVYRIIKYMRVCIYNFPIMSDFCKKYSKRSAPKAWVEIF